jgi:hypothetical protein
MNADAIVLAMLAVGDLALIVHLRQRHARRVQTERVMASLRMAVRRENGVETLPAKRPLLRAS